MSLNNGSLVECWDKAPFFGFGQATEHRAGIPFLFPPFFLMDGIVFGEGAGVPVQNFFRVSEHSERAGF
jgi:hypothetical protein